MHSKPSRAVLHDIQTPLDKFLKIMLMNPTFSTHELLLEFFFVPELQPEMMAERSRAKAAVRAETVMDDYAPIGDDVRDVEQFVAQARDMVRSINAGTQAIIRRGHALSHAQSDLADAVTQAEFAMSSLGQPSDVLPQIHVDSFRKYAAVTGTSCHINDVTPLTTFISTLTAHHGTTLAILSSLSRPTNLIAQLTSTM